MEFKPRFVNGRCPQCGPVTLPTTAVECGVSHADELGLCEFLCPGCERLLLHAIPATDLWTLLLLGAQRSQTLPFELLEPHSGPTVSWDDVFDAHSELEGLCCPQDELFREEVV